MAAQPLTYPYHQTEQITLTEAGCVKKNKKQKGHGKNVNTKVTFPPYKHSQQLKVN